LWSPAGNTRYVRDLDAVCTRAHRPANFGKGMDLADALHLARSRRAAAFVTLV